MAIIRDYNVNVSGTTAWIDVTNTSKTSYAALPTIAEIQSVTGKPVDAINLYNCFRGCSLITTAPAIPSSVTNLYGCFAYCESLTTAPTIPSSVTNMGDCFSNCTALTTAPTIPSSVTNMQSCFDGCTALTTAPTIPSGVTKMDWCFAYCESLTTAPTIPSSVTDMGDCFSGCTALTTAPAIPSSVTNLYGCFSGCRTLTGKIVINTNPSNYTDCMLNTQKSIVLTGSSALLQNIADTANNGNVYVWSLSVNISAERRENDFSKADVTVIINRFRNNSESVSLTFTINSVESAPVQVTMDTATKTYTGVLSISPSSIVELSVIAEDSYGKSAPKSITMPIPFYTIDFKAGGREVAFGSPANDDVSNRPYGLLKCGMDLVVTRLVGEIKMWAGNKIPDGWLLCDGSEVSKTKYPYLYASIGDLWGVPNSSSNFKLPNLNGRVPVGYDGSDTDFDTVGESGGAKSRELCAAIGACNNQPASLGYITEAMTTYQSSHGATYVVMGASLQSMSHWNHSTPVTERYSSNRATSFLQPYVVVKYIICAF